MIPGSREVGDIQLGRVIEMLISTNILQVLEPTNHLSMIAKARLPSERTQDSNWKLAKTLVLDSTI